MISPFACCSLGRAALAAQQLEKSNSADIYGSAFMCQAADAEPGSQGRHACPCLQKVLNVSQPFSSRAGSCCFGEDLDHLPLNFGKIYSLSQKATV